MAPAQTEAPGQALLDALAETVVQRAAEGGIRIALAESCTAGLAADLLARIPGASRVLWGSFVCYTIDAKIRMLKVDEALIGHYGAVSRETARAMAQGALAKSGADIAASVTGLAGPEGDGSATPVGTVWIGCLRRDGKEDFRVFQYSLPRNEFRRAAAGEVLRIVRDAL